MNRRLFSPLLNLALAIGLGAFGAHALETSLSDYAMDVYHTARNYHMWIGLLWLICAAAPFTKKSYKSVSIIMPMGLLFFCGSLYGLSISGMRVLGAITPIGGAIWIGGLIYLSVLALKGDLIFERPQ